MEWKMVERLTRQVVISQHLGGIYGVLHRVILRVDLIVDHALRQRLRRINSQRGIRNRRSRGAFRSRTGDRTRHSLRRRGVRRMFLYNERDNDHRQDREKHDHPPQTHEDLCFRYGMRSYRRLSNTVIPAKTDASQAAGKVPESGSSLKRTYPLLAI